MILWEFSFFLKYFYTYAIDIHSMKWVVAHFSIRWTAFPLLPFVRFSIHQLNVHTGTQVPLWSLVPALSVLHIICSQRGQQTSVSPKHSLWATGLTAMDYQGAQLKAKQKWKKMWNVTRCRTVSKFKPFCLFKSSSEAV